MKITLTQLRRIIKEEVSKEINEAKPPRATLDTLGPQLRAEIISSGKEDLLAKYGADVAATWLSLPIDLPVDKVAKKIKSVQKALGGSPAEAYETNEGIAALLDAIEAAGLSGRRSDKLRGSADNFF